MSEENPAPHGGSAAGDATAVAQEELAADRETDGDADGASVPDVGVRRG